MENDATLPIGDDVGSGPIMLSERFRFYGQAIRTTYVS